MNVLSSLTLHPPREPDEERVSVVVKKAKTKYLPRDTRQESEITPEGNLQRPLLELSLLLEEKPVRVGYDRVRNGNS